MNMPRLLVKGSIDEKARLYPTSLQVSMKVASISTASMTLNKDQPTVSVSDWVRIYTTQGDAGVFVVKTVTTNQLTGDVTVNMEHAICLLKDMHLHEHYNSNGVNVPFDGVLKDLLSLQPVKHWAFGSSAYKDNNPYSWQTASIYSTLTNIMSSLDDPQMSFDTSVYPFKLSIIKRPTEASCEMRISHNVAGMSISVDRSQMYTRLYAYGANDLKLSDSEYIQKNADKYGVICKLETNSDITQREHLVKWANNRLKRHCEPIVTVTISGYDLSSLTNQPFDRLKVGTVCRLPLVEYGGAVIQERIDSVNFNDLIRTPEQCSITLSNAQEDIASVRNVSKQVSSTSESVSRNGKRASSDISNIKEYYEKLDDGFQMRVLKITEDTYDMTKIKQTSESINLSAKKAKKGSAGEWLTEMQSQIDIQAGKIELKV